MDPNGVNFPALSMASSHDSNETKKRRTNLEMNHLSSVTTLDLLDSLIDNPLRLNISKDTSLLASGFSNSTIASDPFDDEQQESNIPTSAESAQMSTESFYLTDDGSSQMINMNLIQSDSSMNSLQFSDNMNPVQLSGGKNPSQSNGSMNSIQTNGNMNPVDQSNTFDSEQQGSNINMPVGPPQMSSQPFRQTGDECSQMESNNTIQTDDSISSIISSDNMNLMELISSFTDKQQGSNVNMPGPPQMSPRPFNQTNDRNNQIGSIDTIQSSDSMSSIKSSDNVNLMQLISSLNDEQQGSNINMPVGQPQMSPQSFVQTSDGSNQMRSIKAIKSGDSISPIISSDNMNLMELISSLTDKQQGSNVNMPGPPQMSPQSFVQTNDQSNQMGSINTIQSGDSIHSIQLSDNINPVRPSDNINPVQLSERMNPIQSDGSMNSIQSNDNMNLIQLSADMYTMQRSDSMNYVMTRIRSPQMNELINATESNYSLVDNVNTISSTHTYTNIDHISSNLMNESAIDNSSINNSLFDDPLTNDALLSLIDNFGNNGRSSPGSNVGHIPLDSSNGSLSSSNNMNNDCFCMPNNAFPSYSHQMNGIQRSMIRPLPLQKNPLFKVNPIFPKDESPCFIDYRKPIRYITKDIERTINQNEYFISPSNDSTDTNPLAELEKKMSSPNMLPRLEEQTCSKSSDVQTGLGDQANSRQGSEDELILCTKNKKTGLKSQVSSTQAIEDQINLNTKNKKSRSTRNKKLSNTETEIQISLMAKNMLLKLKDQTIPPEEEACQSNQAEILVDQMLPVIILIPCRGCLEIIEDNIQAICCEGGCKSWYHRQCSGLTLQAFQALTEDKNAEWICSICIITQNIPPIKFQS